MKSSGPSELGVVMRPGAMIRRPRAPQPKPAATPEVSSGITQAGTTQAVTTKIYIKGLNVVAQCGVYAHEKGRTRPLVVDIDVWVRQDVRSRDDELDQTVDYDVLAAHIHDIAAAAHLQLIETFAEQVCARVLEDPRIERVRLAVEKPGSVANAACSGVEIERTR